MVYTSVSELDFSLTDCPAVPRPNRVLLTSPEHFDVQYVINPHMADKVGTVNAKEAGRQWRALKGAYRALSLQDDVLPGADGLPDMVFCANQTLPFYRPSDGTKGVVLSQMHAEERQGEVPHFERFFRQQGYEVKRLPADLNGSFEGMGDALWHPGRYLLWGGYGFRTTRSAYDQISEMLDVPVLALQLSDDDFYHLDTCMSMLDSQAVLIYPDAFDEDALGLISHFFEHVIEAPEDEARHGFACNAHCPDEEHVLIQRGCETTNQRLQQAGFTPVELDTDEFLKSGGSVFCMKQMFW